VGKVFIALILFALSTFFGIGRAEAACSQSTSDPAAFYCATAAEAYAGAIDITVSQSDLDYVCGSPAGQSLGAVGANGGGQNTYYIGWFDCSINKIHRQSSRVYNYVQQCQTGTAWNDATHTCSQPYDPARCLAKNVDAANPNAITGGAGTCIDSCTYKFVPTNVVGIGDAKVSNGSFQFDGSSCATQPPPTFDYKDPKPACMPVGAGQTMCIKPDGEHCYSVPSASGNLICWTPGETGQKSDGNVTQVRVPGPTEVPPTAPPNDTLNKQGNPVTTSTNNTNSGNITTTTTNYVTGSGSNAPGTPSGEPGSGSGTAPAKEAAGTCGGANQNPCDKAAGGGAGCDQAPTFTGDPLLGNILIQTWRQRCSGNANKSADAGCANGAPAGFTCTGDQTLCQINLHALEKKCRDDNSGDKVHQDAANNPFVDEGNGPSIFHDPTGTPMTLDGSRVQVAGGELIPQITLEGQDWAPPPRFFDVIDMVRMILIAAFTILSMLIAGGSRET
jgi:hypothetical protein